MKYFDRVYGENDIIEPVILDLIDSAPLQRLKDIDQAGYRPFWVNPNADAGEWDYSRFAHSIGVCLLLRKYNAPIEEQIAGLIHDVSHAAFSHCIDYVLDGGSEKTHDHQDKIFKNFVLGTEIPGILEKRGFDVAYILNDDNFPFKEKDLPDLCADRIDYSLRAAVIFEEVGVTELKSLLDNLIAKKRNWVFKNFQNAKMYAELFKKLNDKYYSGLQSAKMFRSVGDCLKYALEKGYVSQEDLYLTDKIVVEEIANFAEKDEKLNSLFERMNAKVRIDNNPSDYDASVFCKSRVVDPLFMDGEKIRRLSEADLYWREILKLDSEPRQYFLKFADDV